MPRRTPLLPSLLALLLAAACSAPPAARVDTPFGAARAGTAAEAEALAALLLEYGPAVRASLPDALDRPTEVWLEDFARYGDLRRRPGVVGLTSVPAGHIRIRADRLGRDADFVLVHELVHALLGPSWRPLPAVVAEGLCDALAARLAPASGARVRAVRLADAAFDWPRLGLELRVFDPARQARPAFRLPLGDGPGVDPRSALQIPGPGLHLGGQRGDEPVLYGYGLLVAERILARHGVARLHALCTAATAAGLEQVPADWLLAAAELDEDPASWRRALLEGLRPEDLREQCRYVAAPLADWLVATFRARHPERDARGFLATALPTLGWTGSQVRVALSTVPGLAESLEARWAARGPSALRPGDGWWLRDAEGVHLTTILGPTPDDPAYTLSRLRMDAAPLQLSAEQLGAGDVEAYLRLFRRDGRVVLASALPGGLAAFRVELDGFVVADLAAGRGVRPFIDDRGWQGVEVVLDAPLRLHELVLHHPAANLLVSQRAAGAPEWAALHFPIWMPRQR